MNNLFIWTVIYQLKGSESAERDSKIVELINLLTWYKRAYIKWIMLKHRYISIKTKDINLCFKNAFLTLQQSHFVL